MWHEAMREKLDGKYSAMQTEKEIHVLYMCCPVKTIQLSRRFCQSHLSTVDHKKMCKFFEACDLRGTQTTCLLHKGSQLFTDLTRKPGSVFATDPVYLKYPNYVSLRCCSTIPKLSLVSVIVGILQCCCCYSYHPSQEQIACQNKRSYFRPMERKLPERMQF